MDWCAGRYEHVAEQLLPAARALVEAAAPAPGESVLDIGSGTGSASLLAAQRGASVVGVDPSTRLLEVAAAAASRHGLDARFLAGVAESLPLPDDSADVVISSFGIIFAADPTAAAGELARVARDRARALFTAWLPSGTIAEAVGALRETLARVCGAPSAAPAFAWHSAEAVGALLAPYGFALEMRETELAFAAPSPQAFLEDQMRDHPMWIAARPALERSGELAPLRERVLAILAAGNEDGRAFRTTSRYVIARMTR